MDTIIIDAVGDVTEKVFNTMVSLSPERCDPTDSIVPQTLYDVTAIVGITGTIVGTIAVQFQSPLAMKVTANMLQMPVDSLTEDVRDAIGEIGNMVAGGLKTDLSPKGVDFDISIPTVVMGPGHSISHAPGSETLFFPFEVEGQYFIVSVSIKS